MAGVRQLVQLIKSVPCTSDFDSERTGEIHDDVFHCKVEAIECLGNYCSYLTKKWGEPSRHMEALDIIYGVIPVVNRLNEYSQHQVASSFYLKVLLTS